jgi:CHASE3 domain sensor protein
LREIREEIIKERQRQVYAQEEMREKILAGIIILFGIGIVVGMIVFIASG